MAGNEHILPEPDYYQLIAKELAFQQWQVKAVLELAENDNTVHFIARYRKERTGDLDENNIRDIIELKSKLQRIHKAKETALKNIEEQGKLTPTLRSRIEKAQTLTEVEDLYAPFKRKRKTNADKAREKGFGVIAGQIRNQESITIPEELLAKYSEEEIIRGGLDIVSQDIADDANFKSLVRKFYFEHGKLSSKYKNKDKFDEKQKSEAHKFEIYGDFKLNITKLKSYQTLAINRGENLGILMVKMDKDEGFYNWFRNRIVFKEENSELLDTAITEGYIKIFASIEREVRNFITERAEVDAIKVFKVNLKRLLMLKPHYGKSVLGIDPGYRTGCKVCLLNRNGNPIHFSKFFLADTTEAMKTLGELLSSYQVDVVIIGNGTGSGEVYDLVSQKFDIPVVLVNESGASVYSVSEAGQEEFPDLDATDRGTISIARRYIDCLSELVKIPVISIGVGMYQHDMSQKELERQLTSVVEDVVNLVGINVNSASGYLLSYVSGLNKRTAARIFENKPYHSREELINVLTPKSYEQSVGFLRVPDSPNEFDRTAIHPEQYNVAKFIVKHIDEENIFNRYRTQLDELYPGITNTVIQDIIHNYRDSGKELRQYDGNLKLQASYKAEDLRVGDVVEGIIRNVTQFGAFVDIGLKNDGLIHISQLADRFVKDPLDVVSIGEEVRVKVIDIDLERGRISLSMINI